VDAEARRVVEEDVADRLAFVAGPGVLRVSGLTGRGVHRILPTILTAAEAYRSRIPTGELNRFLAKVQAEHPARDGRVLYGVQGAVNPPTFTLFVNRELPQGYVRFLEHRLRQEFALEATPVQIRLRRRR
jgi:GTP-binding protein